MRADTQRKPLGFQEVTSSKDRCVSFCVVKINEFECQYSFSVISMVWSNVLNQIAVLNDCSKDFNEFNRLIFTIIQVFNKLCSLNNHIKILLLLAMKNGFLIE